MANDPARLKALQAQLDITVSLAHIAKIAAAENEAKKSEQVSGTRGACQTEGDRECCDVAHKA